MDTLLQDIRYAARKLVRAPGFTTVAALTLGLAIGATTVIFSVVNGVLLEPLPFRDPERLVRVASVGREGRPTAMSAPDFLDYRGQSKSVASMAAIEGITVNMTGRGEPERLSAARVSGSFFSILGVQPAIGRTFSPEDDTRGAERVVVLSNALWRRHFGADPKIVGQSITLDANPFTVIGVAPVGFTYPSNPEIWVPLVLEGPVAAPDNRGAHYLGGIGRLAAGATVEQANAELAQIAAQLAELYPSTNANFGGMAVSLQEYTVGDARKGLLVMLGAVSFVLLIACANVANLLLVRAASRSTEMAVRTALGAGRGRILRQLLTESLILALLGSGVGLLLAVWGLDLLVAFGPQNLPRLDEVRIDGPVLGFAVGISLLTGLLFGLVPAVHASRPNLHEMLKEGARGSSAGGGRLRSTLVMAEMALAVVLLIGAGLLIRSFARLLDVDPGFRTENVYTYTIAPPEPRYERTQPLRALVSDLVERARTLPEAQSVGATFGLPLGNYGIRTIFEIEGLPRSEPGDRRITGVASVTPGFFETMKMRVLHGRSFTAEDRLGRQKVVIVNEALAKRYFPGESPLGKRIELGWELDTAAVAAPEGTARDSAARYAIGGEIIGVVADVKQQSIAGESPAMTYVPFDQAPIGLVSVVVRSTAQPAAVHAAARAQLRALDRDLPLFDFRPVEDLVSDSVAQPRFYAILLGSFAAIALLLAAVGIYGVISYAVAQRTRELGIRVALGATGPQVLRLVLGRGLVLTATGVLAGLVVAFWLTRLLVTLLFGVEPADPLTFASVAVVLTGVAALASYVPARRAARVDPVIALRSE